MRRSGRSVHGASGSAGIIDRSLETRKRVYEAFARDANAAGVRWIVLHGSEGYPARVGRDLDVICASAADTRRLLELFAACLRAHGFRWVIHPSPLWGRRVVGVDADYAAAELHVLGSLRVGNVHFVPDWRAVEYVGDLFPIERFVTFCKGCLIPALVGDAAWREKCATAPTPGALPWWVARAARQAIAGEAVSPRSKLVLCIGFLLSYPLASAVNTARWLARRVSARLRPTVPLFILLPGADRERLERVVRERLAGLFHYVVRADGLSRFAIRKLKSRQILVYITEAEGRLARDAVPIRADGLDDDGLAELLVSSFAEFNRRWAPETRRRRGMMVVVLGPDGSGKSSVVQEVVSLVAQAFRRTALLHLRPRLGMRQYPEGVPVIDPHGAPPRGVLTSIVKLGYLVFDYGVGYLARIWPARVRSTLVVFDRYYHDLLVDPRRYRYGGPMWLARAAGALVPKPDLWVVLDAPPEVLQARKQEVSLAETTRQCQAYRDLARRLGNAIVIDAAQPVERVVADVARAILEHMAERTAKRLGQENR